MKKLLLIFFLTVPEFVYCQSYQKEFATNFAWEVKQINEFIERFNNDSTLIKEYQKKYNRSTSLTREKLIKSLFNTQKKDWNYSEIIDFIKQVDDVYNPEFLDFHRDNWYATLNCSVLWNGKPKNAILKLQIERLPSGGYKWVIADVKAKFLEPKSAEEISNKIKKVPKLLIAMDSTVSLNPMSHITDFERIDEISDNTSNIGNYIIKADQYSNDFCLFINECVEKHLKITNVNTITYTFLQIDGWRIDIQQFNRDSKNAGWLINKLIKLPS